MLCQNCKKNAATSHFHSVVGGIVKDSYLCAECAAAAHSDFFDNNIFKMFFNEFEPQDKIAVNTKRCDCCGSTFADIANSGKVGCAECYSVFLDELEPSLLRIHGKTCHVGKKQASEAVEAPIGTEEGIKPESDVISELKRELKAAIEAENYEKAALLRDKIKGLEANG